MNQLLLTRLDQHTGGNHNLSIPPIQAMSTLLLEVGKLLTPLFPSILSQQGQQQ